MKRIIALLVLLVFVAGCDSLNTLIGTNQNKAVATGFGGTSAVSLSLVEDAPLKEISRDKQLRFTLNVKNKGTFTIPGGGFMARVTGLDNNFNPSELLGTNSQLIGRVDESGIGGDVNIELGSTSYNPEQMFTDRIIKAGDLQVEVCYLYETRVVADNFWIGTKTSQVSKGSISSGDNSNAPVQVLELDERGGGDSTTFTFKVKVVGSGSVVSSCFPVSDDDKKKKVDLQIYERDVSCYYEDAGEKKVIGSQGSIFLNSMNEKIVHCTIPFAGEKPVKTQFQMALTYYYLDKVSVPQITIRKI